MAGAVAGVSFVIAMTGVVRVAGVVGVARGAGVAAVLGVMLMRIALDLVGHRRMAPVLFVTAAHAVTVYP